MNSASLADAIVEQHGLTKVQAKGIVDGIFKSITDAARAGDEVSLPGFGKFKVQSRPEREGRNPRTGETMSIAASKKLAFQPAKGLRDALNA